MVVAMRKGRNIKVISVNSRWTVSDSKYPHIADLPATDDDIADEIRNPDKVAEAVQALIELNKVTTAERPPSLFESEAAAVFLQVTCVKIPKTPDRIVRIYLPHGLKTDTSDVCLFVPDIVKGTKDDHEPTVEHYQNLLAKQGVSGITQIIPLRQLRTEHYQYELRRRLCHSYDFFLAEGKICGRLTPLLGKEFRSRRKAPTPLKLDSKDLKGEIEKALRKTPLYLSSKGDSQIVQVAHTNLTAEQIAENIIASIEALRSLYPGGWRNIKSLQIKTAKSLSVPVYLNLKTANAVDVPVASPKKPKAAEPVEGELSTIPGTVVTVLPSGDIIVKKVKDDLLSDESECEESEDEESQEGTKQPSVQRQKNVPKQLSVQRQKNVPKQPSVQRQKNVPKPKNKSKVVKEDTEDADSGVEAAEDAYLSEWLHEKIETEETKPAETKLKKRKRPVNGKRDVANSGSKNKPKRKKIKSA